ncbi:MAG: hypothetical protein LC677_14970 [Halomonas sp.]|nr:hypothetical protein [Halomonas sp.]
MYKKTLSGLTLTMLMLGNLLLIGCSARPSESDARSVYENQLGNLLKDGTVKIKSFKKVNGYTMGETFYSLEFEAETEFLKDYPSKCWTNGRWFWQCGPQMNTRNANPKGIIKVQEEIRFRKTENGWKGPDGNVY